jgi:predicted DNA-binding transcriptional regulator AlpA
MRKPTILKEAQPPEQPLGSTVVMPRLWDQKQLAAYLGKSTAWCERSRWEGEGPKFFKLGRHVRYKTEDVLDWIEEKARTCTREVK